ncbi:ladinin-1 [Cololabis saira]|uniref:ladinin-1 n=1 Tax=Cololabis saira TaxID=129043 RepID=UPI002AD5263D|nr:ladinin-1 [Cololabis saira]
MSFSRKNWSALSSLARQWTMEDEEEIEREKRRREKSGSTEGDADSSSTPRSPSSGDDNSGTNSSSETSQGLNSVEQDFVEMLRVRDEKRRMRLVETLRQQKEDEENDGEPKSGPGEGDARVVLLGELDEEKDTVSKPKPPPKTSSYCPTTSSINNSKTRTNKHEDAESSRRDPDPQPASAPARKFVSSLSVSLDHPPSPSASGPTSPCSPAFPLSPRDRRPSSSQSASPREPKSPVQNGHARETSLNGPSTNGKVEQTSKPAFIRQSSRTLSFRMMKKKEDEGAPLQRSSSVRIASKKFESPTDKSEDEDKSFQRNSKQRISSRSIKEKMEKLAQAAQKSEQTRSPDVTQRTLFLLEEVSRKRGLFEKEPPAQSLTSPGVSRQEYRSFQSGMSDRINRWLNKTYQPGTSPIPSDLRHVDITSKRSLFENSEEESVARVDPGSNK